MRAILGFKAAVIGGIEQRPEPAGRDPLWKLSGWMTTLTIAVFAKCVELKIVPTFHTSTLNFGYRSSTTNFTYNHVGHFAAGCEALCKSIFMGGITRRFPQLKIAFLEGGAAWACNLYNDLVRHWKIRNPKALENVDPARLDRELMLSFIDRVRQPADAPEGDARDARRVPGDRAAGIPTSSTTSGAARSSAPRISRTCSSTTSTSAARPRIR